MAIVTTEVETADFFCSCTELCWLCEAHGMKRGKRLSDLEVQVLYWSDLSGMRDENAKAVIREACKLNPILCSRAWGTTKERMENATLGRRESLREPGRYFLRILGDLVTEWGKANR